MKPALAWRLARRELRGGLRGFRVLVACLALGVAAIAGAGSLNATIQASLLADARALLGGDLALRLTHRPAEREQLDVLAAMGVVSQAIELRAMALPEVGAVRQLVELKGVDAAYPLYGALETDAPTPPAEALARRDGAWGALADPNLLTRLGLDVGDRLRVGDAVFELRGVIRREPDRAASMFSLGPRLMVAREAVAETGLVQPGSLIRYVYLLRLAPGLDVASAKELLAERFPRAGWQVRDPGDAAPGIRRFLDNMTMFLTLVGLASLLVGGIGVANAVKAFVDGRMTTVAILKCLGAPSRLVLAVYGIQVGLLAMLGIAIGAAVGALVPPAAAWAFGDMLPVPVRIALHPQPLLLAAGFGILTALAFGFWPLSRAAAVPAAALFRRSVAGLTLRPAVHVFLVAGGASAALAALAIVSAHNRSLAAWFVVGSIVSLAIFRGAGAAVTALARLATRRPTAAAGRPALRLGLSRMHRPGAATGTVVLSLGLGLTVLVAIALVEGNLTRQIAERLPDEAPAFFFIDIQGPQVETFDAALAAVEGVGAVKRAPMVRGRIVAIKGVPVDRAEIAAEAEWAVRGDRGLTSAATPPDDTRIVAGEWWAPDHSGPPLVSMDAGIARGFGVGVGDTVTVNVLGRDITATVANLREIDWSSLGMNFTFVLSPNALAGAPVAWIATVEATPAAEDAVERAVVDRLPNVSAIRVRQALESVKGVLEGVAAAVRAAGAVTVLAGVLVLAGAIAAGHRRRIYEAVVLKALGATRSDLLRAYLVEYGLLGIATGLLAGMVGAVVAWAVLRFVLRADWAFLPGLTAGTVAACTAVVLVMGFAGTWRALGARVAPLLRNE